MLVVGVLTPLVTVFDVAWDAGDLAATERTPRASPAISSEERAQALDSTAASVSETSRASERSLVIVFLLPNAALRFEASSLSITATPNSSAQDPDRMERLQVMRRVVLSQAKSGGHQILLASYFEILCALPR